ncbi:MAG: DUF5926 family protein [Gordonia sp. (in: high G+C Gram-positive bacteria)]|uniref:DUF5926 family protein n=1 Tax=Gordonia sp. (in: high G+C Gram-positive bacteria) TaxID=84139 RepID=UPI0039E6704A
MAKSKRGSGPRPGSNRAERVAARKERQAATVAAPARPFQTLPAAECDLVALRAFVASASAQVSFASGFDAPNEADWVTILPGAVPGIVRQRLGAIWGEKGGNAGDADGKVTQGLVGLQTDPEPADLTGSLAAALTWAASAEPDAKFEAPSDVTKIEEIVDPSAPLKIMVYEDFEWWFGDDADSIPPQAKAMLEQANATIMPTSRMKPKSCTGAPWWVHAGAKAHLRWVRPEDENALMDALAKVNAAGSLTLGEGSRFAGSFRTHGLLVPVFDLDPEKHSQEWQEGLDAFDAAVTQALADTSELTAAERSARKGIIGRQVTLRV